MSEPRQPLEIDASRISRQGTLQLENLAGEVIIAEKALRRLEIVDSPDLSSLDVCCRAHELILHNADLQTLDIGECRLLESIDGEFQAGRMRVSVCKALRRVSGSGQTLDISCCDGADDLHIGSDWDSVSILQGGFDTLSIRRSQRLQLTELPNLRFLEYEHIGSLGIDSDTCDADRLTAWFVEEPGRLEQWLGNVCGSASGTTDAFNLLTERWIDRAASQNEHTRLAGILASLTELAGNPEDIAAVWRLRCALMTARLRHAGSDPVAGTGDPPWSWGIDPRANPAVWRQDLALLQACKDFAPASHALLSMRQQGRVAQVWALAKALSDESAGSTERNDLRREWLQGSLEQLDLRIEQDVPLARGVRAIPPPPNLGWAGRLAHAARHQEAQSLLPEFARMICKLDPADMSETLAGKMVDQIPDAGDLLIEVGLGFHRAGAAGARVLLATGLSTAGNLSATTKAEVMEALLAAQGRS